MGYRSDVAIAVYGGRDQMIAFIAAARMDRGVSNIWGECTIYPFSDPYSHTEEPRPCLMLEARFEDVKWYDSYPDVQSWHRLLNRVHEADEISYEFVRIGENADDVILETHGDPSYFLTVRRWVESTLPEEDAHEATTAA